MGEFLAACGDAGADCINSGAQFDDALRARVDERYAKEEYTKPDVDRLIKNMGMSNFRTK